MSNKDDVEYDPYCDPANPRKIEYSAIAAAHQRIMGQIVRTPCRRALMSDRLGIEIYLKLDILQYTGGFKERGLRNTLLQLDDEKKKNGVVAASMGNHGCAVSFHSTQLGIQSFVVMPIFAPVSKVTKCEKFGAKCILYGVNMADAKHHAMTLAKEKNMLYVNGFDHPHVIEGQGSCGIEIMEQVPDVDAVLIPCGGGSLLAGVGVAAKYLKPDVEIYGCETEATASMLTCMKNHERKVFPLQSTIADGLAVALVGVNTFHTIHDTGIVNKMVAVSEDWVARTIMHLVEEEKFVVEGGGATPLACVLAGLLPQLKGKKVVCICSGGNIDVTTLGRAIERGMAEEGRLVKFKVTLSDKPGGIAPFCQLMSTLDVTIRDCYPKRAWIKNDAHSVELKATVETKGWEHVKELIMAVKKNYKLHYFAPFYDELFASQNSRRGPCLAPNPVCMKRC